METDRTRFVLDLELTQRKPVAGTERAKVHGSARGPEFAIHSLMQIKIPAPDKFTHYVAVDEDGRTP